MAHDGAGLGRADVRAVLPRLAGIALVAGILSGALPLLLLQSVPDVGRSNGWILTIMVMIWSGFRLAYRVVDGRPMLFDFVFWLFAYVFMGLAPTVQIRSDGVSTTTPGMNPDLDVPAAVAVIVGLVAYEAGRWLARRRGAVKARALAPKPRLGPASHGLREIRRPEIAPSEHLEHEMRADSVDGRRAAILALIGLGTAAYYVSRIGVGTLFMSRYAAFEIRSAALPDLALRSILDASASYPLLIAAVAFARLRATSPPGPRRDAYGVGFLATLPVLLLITNPISSARYDFGTVGFALAVALGAMITIRRARVAMGGTLFALMFVFPIADAFRTDIVNVERLGFFAEYSDNPDYDGFWQIANTLAYLHDVGLNVANQFFGVMFFWVPRAIWPEKPVDTGILLANYRGYSFNNLSAPLWAELMINGSTVLLVLGFVVIGAALRRLDVRIAASLLGRGQWWSIVGAVFPFYMVILLRGSLLQATGALVVALACLFAVRSPRRRQPANGVAVRGHAPRSAHAGR